MGAPGGRGPRESGAVNGYGEMPGRLMMDHQGATGPEDPKKDRSQAQEGRVRSPVHSRSAQDTSHLPAHGQNGGLLNGKVTGSPPANGRHNDAPDLFWNLGQAPPLDQSWRTSDANKPLGKLIGRLAQQCYADLHQVIEEMNNLGPVDAPAPQKSVVQLHNSQDQCEPSLAKKRKLLDFASEQRDRFIKTLILANWGRDEEDIAKLIDLKVWLDLQRNAHEHAARDIGQIKIDAIPVKTPNPNIDHALELLATSRASWVPDLGYLPVKKLTAKQLLNTLRNMNVALATRLNLHDELPPHMQQFSIADGRATFIVPGEFHVDLAVADEDPSSPFFFIDIRFLFTPSTDALRDQLRGPVENQINAVLVSKGLQACYELLHNFVLTAKIRTLRDQAEKLSSGKWFDCLRVESKRRIVTIQYWIGRPGPKSWLECGIVSGKIPGKHNRKPPTPCMSVRWFRAGIQVPTDGIDFDWVDLNVERCLLSVIAQHAIHDLRTIQNRLTGFAPSSPALTAVTLDVAKKTDGGKLVLDLPALSAPLATKVELITGRYSIVPPSVQALNSEKLLNSNPTIDAAAVVAALACAMLRAQFDMLAVPLGWLPARVSAFKDPILATLLGVDVRKHRLIRCGQGWSSDWALLVVFGLGGTSWWIVNLEEKPASIYSERAHIIKAHHQLPDVHRPDKAPRFSQAMLLRIEKLAAARISSTVLAQSLVENRISHSTEKLPLTVHSPDTYSSTAPAVPPMFVRFSSVMRDRHSKTWKPWAAETMRVAYQGIERDHDGSQELAAVRHDIRLSFLPGKMMHLQQHLTRKPNTTIAINATGGLAIQLLTPFGKSPLEQIMRQLQKVERLDQHVTSLVRRKFECTVVSPARLAFQYNSSPSLSAEVLFRDAQPSTLRFEPRDSNPHIRIRVMLEKGLNDPSEVAFDTFATMLTLTLPVLQAMDELVTLDHGGLVLAIHARSSTWYTLKYKTPLPSCSFSIRARTSVQQNRKIIHWHVAGPQAPSPTTPVSDDLAEALKELWQSRDEHSLGLGNGVIADVLGIGSVIRKVDEIVRGCSKAEEGPTVTQPVATAAKIKAEADFITID